MPDKYYVKFYDNESMRRKDMPCHKEGPFINRESAERAAERKAHVYDSYSVEKVY